MCEKVDAIETISASVLEPYVDPRFAPGSRNSIMSESDVDLGSDSRTPLERLFGIKLAKDQDSEEDGERSPPKGASPRMGRKIKSSSSMVFDEVQKIEDREAELIEKMINLEGKMSRSNSISRSRSSSISGGLNNIARGPSFC